MRVDLRMHRQALSDQDVENCVETIRHGVKELAQRRAMPELWSEGTMGMGWAPQDLEKDRKQQNIRF